MDARAIRREDLIARAAEHLLEAGLAGANLRPLAAALGTSDRMLLYYFRDKEELLTEVLGRVASRLTLQLDAAMPSTSQRAYPQLLREVWTALQADGVSAFMHLWLDLAAGATRGEEPQRRIAGQIADGFLAWVEVRLAAAPEVRAGEAALLLATVEGLLLLQAVGRGELSARALA